MATNEKNASGAVTPSRMYQTERDGMLALLCAVSMLESQRNVLGARIKRYGLQELSDELLRDAHLLALELENSMTDEQHRNLEHNVNDLHYSVHTRPVPQKVEADNYGWKISFSMLNIILDALHEHCIVCAKDVQEQKSCKLRSVLDTIGSNIEHDGDTCGYQWEVSQCEATRLNGT